MVLQNDFSPDLVLSKPLMAHLATCDDGAPRSSPLWFLYEDEAVWLFGVSEDSFIKRLEAEPSCALSIVDFDLNDGVLLHVGVRGVATVGELDSDRLKRFVGKYLGGDAASWNEWFVENVVDPIDRMVKVKVEALVAKDVSYF
jgi:nitroimidazol reductase NimA-like FMN-containing flavoprotein (pyridoxamine 5'-phosphate oxidase superfamily)